MMHKKNIKLTFLQSSRIWNSQHRINPYPIQVDRIKSVSEVSMCQ